MASLEFQRAPPRATFLRLLLPSGSGVALHWAIALNPAGIRLTCTEHFTGIWGLGQDRSGMRTTSFACGMESISATAGLNFHPQKCTGSPESDSWEDLEPHPVPGPVFFSPWGPFSVSSPSPR